MQFDFVKIRSDNGTLVAYGYRADLALGETVTMTLAPVDGITTYAWEMTGRHEDSLAGGAGPLPVSLGAASSATFDVDYEGTYVVQCTVNAGLTNEARIQATLAVAAGTATLNGRTVTYRLPTSNEVDGEDFATARGWAGALRYFTAQLENGFDPWEASGMRLEGPDLMGTRHQGTDLSASGPSMDMAVIPGLMQCLTAAPSAMNVNVNTGLLRPVFIQSAGLLHELIIWWQNKTNTGNVSFALYEDLPLQCYPGRRLWTSGLVAMSSLADPGRVTVNQRLVPGRYWLGAQNDQDMITSGARFYALPRDYGDSTLGCTVDAANGTFTQPGRAIRAQGAGMPINTWPDPLGTTYTPVVLTYTSGEVVPMIGYTWRAW